MKLYRYKTNGADTLVCTEFDGYEEKERSYCNELEYPRRIAKDRIGTVQPDIICSDEVWLTERDDARAAGLFVSHIEEKIEEARSRCKKYAQTIETISRQCAERKYTWEEDEEAEYWERGKFDSIDDCMTDAKENHNRGPGSMIAVGIIEPYEISVDADAILEGLEEDAYDQCGESAGGWSPTSQKGEDKEALSRDITEIVRHWLKKHNDMPGVYKIADMRSVKLS